MQISVDINDSFTLKCCATTQMKALLYFYRLRMMNMLFVEQISRQINFFSKIFSDVSSLWRRLSITCQATKKIKFHRYADMGRTLERQWKWAKTVERNSQHLHGFFINLPVNVVQRSIASIIRYSIGQKKKLVFIIWPAKIRVCPS